MTPDEAAAAASPTITIGDPAGARAAVRRQRMAPIDAARDHLIRMEQALTDSHGSDRSRRDALMHATAAQAYLTLATLEQQSSAEDMR